MVVSVFVVISHITLECRLVVLDRNLLFLDERLSSWSSVTAKFALAYVNFDVCIALAGSWVDWAKLSVVDLLFDVKLGVCVTLVWFAVAVRGAV